MGQGIGSIDQTTLGGPEKLDSEKQKKVKDLLGKVLDHLKELLASKPNSISDVKNMIEMAREYIK